MCWLLTRHLGQGIRNEAVKAAMEHGIAAQVGKSHGGIDVENVPWNDHDQERDDVSRDGTGLARTRGGFIRGQ